LAFMEMFSNQVNSPVFMYYHYYIQYLCITLPSYLPSPPRLPFQVCQGLGLGQ